MEFHRPHEEHLFGYFRTKLAHKGLRDLERQWKQQPIPALFGYLPSVDDSRVEGGGC